MIRRPPRRLLSCSPGPSSTAPAVRDGRAPTPPGPPGAAAAPGELPTTCQPGHRLPGLRRRTPGADGDRRRPRRPRRWTPGWSSCCAGCGCRTCAASPPRSSPSPKPSGGTPPKCSAPCSPRKSPGATAPSLATRRARAAFPTGKTFDAWDEHLSSIPAPTQAALRTLEWISRHENLVVCGPSGTGKTFLLEALGQAAVETGKHVAWFTLEAPRRADPRHRADDSVTKAIGRILRADLVVVDDIGLLPVGPDAAEGLYRLVDAAYEKAQHGCQLQPAPVRIRRADAQDPGHRHRRPAHAPRPRLPDQRGEELSIPVDEEFQAASASSALAAAGAGWLPSGACPAGRSTSLPSVKTAPARTSATRWGALTRRQRRWADSMSL